MQKSVSEEISEIKGACSVVEVVLRSDSYETGSYEIVLGSSKYISMCDTERLSLLGYRVIAIHPGTTTTAVYIKKIEEPKSIPRKLPTKDKPLHVSLGDRALDELFGYGAEVYTDGEKTTIEIHFGPQEEWVNRGHLSRLTGVDF